MNDFNTLKSRILAFLQNAGDAGASPFDMIALFTGVGLDATERVFRELQESGHIRKGADGKWRSVLNFAPRQVEPTFRVELRDAFAASALTGLLAGKWLSNLDDDPGAFARTAYAFANAMLEARKK